MQQLRLPEIQTLSTALCKPVGGLAPQVQSAIVNFIATESESSSSTLPPTLTAMNVGSLSVALASATLSPSLGNSTTNGTVTGGGSPPAPKPFTAAAAGALKSQIGRGGISLVVILGLAVLA